MQLLFVSGTKRQRIGGECVMVSFVITLITKYYSSEQIKKKEMGWACSPYGKEMRVALGRHEGKRPFG
jgi:hypothetical protein